MNSSVFGTIPKENDFKIPFKLTEDFLSQWLLKLSKHKTLEACALVLQLLQALNKTKLTAKVRVSFLNIIHEHFKSYLKILDSSCWDASLPLSEKECRYAEAIVWNYLALGEGFFIAAQDSSARTDEMLALYMACYCVGQAQLHTAAVYKTPAEDFWQLTYQIVSWVEKFKLLDTKINNSDLKEKTLNNMLAQIIIFQSCDTNQFRPRDMRTIFNFLPKVCDKFSFYKLTDIKFQTEVLNIAYHHAISNRFGNLGEKLTEKINGRQDLLVFDLNENVPPSIFNQPPSLITPTLRYFTAASVVENLEQVIYKNETWTGVLKSINNELFSRVIKTLEPGRKRKHDRSQSEVTMLGVIGFENIASFLYKINKQNNLKAPPKIATNAPSSYEELKSYADTMKTQMGALDGGYDVIPFAYSSASDCAIWGANENSVDITNRHVSLKKLTIFDHSATGYSVHWADDVNSKTKIGDIFGIISADKKRLEVAIIRRIIMQSVDDYRFGTEILGVKSEVLVVTQEENPNVGGWVVFIPGVEAQQQADSIIYHIGNFHVGNFVYIYRQNKKIKAVLVKELNATSAIVHAELEYLDSVPFCPV